MFLTEGHLNLDLGSRHRFITGLLLRNCVLRNIYSWDHTEFVSYSVNQSSFSKTVTICIQQW